MASVFSYVQDPFRNPLTSVLLAVRDELQVAISHSHPLYGEAVRRSQDGSSQAKNTPPEITSLIDITTRLYHPLAIYTYYLPYPK